MICTTDQTESWVFAMKVFGVDPTFFYFDKMNYRGFPKIDQIGGEPCW